MLTRAAAWCAQVRDEKSEQLLASAEVPLRCIGDTPFELGAEAYAPQPTTGKGGKSKGDRAEDDAFSSALSALAPQMPPCSITLWRAPPAAALASVKHLFLIAAAESALTDAFSILHGSKEDRRAEAAERKGAEGERRGAASEMDDSPEAEKAHRRGGPVSRFGAMLERGGQAVQVGPPALESV